jgi:hypothetical protein
MTRISPFASRSTRSISFAAEKRINSSSVTGDAVRRRDESGNAATDKFMVAVGLHPLLVETEGGYRAKLVDVEFSRV